MPNLSNGFFSLTQSTLYSFAANIWNDYPVPTYASVFMILGGVFALIISLFAIQDFRLLYSNYQLIRRERHFLKHLLNSTSNSEEEGSRLNVQELNAYLEVNFRELGNEIARSGMDAIMGLRTFLVGTGTLLVLGGTNPRVFHASNLLSGYIGNVPIAFYGLISSTWSLYLFQKNIRPQPRST